MKISDQILMCFGNLLHRKMRTLLTITGVMVGTCLVVIVISLGLGMNLQQEKMLESMGDLNKIEIYNYGFSGDSEAPVLDDAAISQIAELPGVDVATPIYRPEMQAAIYSGKEDRYKMQLYNIQGMYAEAMPKIGYQLLEGDYPTRQPNAKKPVNILVGEFAGYSFEDTKKKFNNYRWPEEDENGELKQQPFVQIMTDDLILRTDKMEEDSPESTVVSREIKVAGRIKQDYNKGWETSEGVFMDINDIKQIEAAYKKANKIKTNQSGDKKEGYSEALVYVHTIDDVDAVDTAIKALGFETRSLEDIRKPMQENIKQQQLFLGLLGGVSLVVAAIGITNTMYMSIYERTREIGVMKVLGCKVGNIRSVFLMEAGSIGFIGGCVGALLSFAGSSALNYFKFSFGNTGQSRMYGYGGGGGGDPSSVPVSLIPLWLIGAAILFATMIGLLSGILPANRAMKISALEAIKHE